MKNLLFENVGIVDLAATTKKFIVRKHYSKYNKEVRISYVNNYFGHCFNDIVENPLPKTKLKTNTIMKESTIKTISKIKIANETTLSRIWQMLKKQRKGRKGKLINARGSNIFYVIDFNGKVKAVHILWGFNGWIINCYLISDTVKLSENSRIFSRIS